MCTYMPDSEKDKCRREQQSQHVTEGRECERHFPPVPSVGSWLGRRMMQAAWRPLGDLSARLLLLREAT